MKILRLEEIDKLPELGPLTPEEEAEAYKLAREAFTAADLQKYTLLDEDECVPMEDMLAEMEEIRRKAEEKRRGEDGD